MVRNLAKQAMTTSGQKACVVIDHLVESLANDGSSSLRRAIILVDIDQYPGTTQTGVMERLNIHKSAVNREIDWLFNYGCIMMSEAEHDARAKKITICGYAKKALDKALDYFNGDHEALKSFLSGFHKIIKQEKPTLRDVKVVTTLYEKKAASKQEIMDSLYEGSASTKNRTLNKLVEDGIVDDAA